MLRMINNIFVLFKLYKKREEAPPPLFLCEHINFLLFIGTPLKHPIAH